MKGRGFLRNGNGEGTFAWQPEEAGLLNRKESEV